MSHYSKVFNKVPVQIKNRSGYDESHENLWTGNVGTLIPTFWDWLRPGESISLGTMANVNMPPMATDWYGKCDFHTEFFAVPCRVLWAGFQKYVSHLNGAANAIASASGGESQISEHLPNFTIDGAYLGAGSLADYLGFKVLKPVAGTNYTLKNGMPMLAYHKIWEDWFRQPNVMKPAFVEYYNSSAVANSVAFLPYSIVGNGALTNGNNNFSGTTLSCFDGEFVYSLRQRCFSKDYFTNSSLRPQASNNPAAVSFTVANNAGSFSIPALRAANSLQQFLERQNLMGISSTYNGNEAYYNTIIGQFGVKPSDYAMGRAIYLGRTVSNVYNRSVFQSAEQTQATQNPFSTVATKYASSQAVSQGSLCDKFTAGEDMIIMAISSLVPHQYYGTGIDRKLMIDKPSDLPWPLLAGIGDQAIYNYELNGNPSDTTVFGYTGYMDHFKFKDDQVHGLFRDGESLESFVLQTSFGMVDAPALGSTFLEIPTDYMDGVTAVNAEMSTYGYWVDQYFSYKKTSELPVYSIPTLEDIKDTHTEIVDKNGKRL